MYKQPGRAHVDRVIKFQLLHALQLEISTTRPRLDFSEALTCVGGARNHHSFLRNHHVLVEALAPDKRFIYRFHEF